MGSFIVNSLVAVHRLGCSMACRILVPPPGIESRSPALHSGFLTTEPSGKTECVVFYCNFFTEISLTNYEVERFEVHNSMASGMFISLVAQIVKSLLARRPGFNL